MRPVCCKCQVEMRCVKTGFDVDDRTGRMFSGDKYGCPVCGVEVVVGFGQPWEPPEHYKGDLMLLEAKR